MLPTLLKTPCPPKNVSCPPKKTKKVIHEIHRSIWHEPVLARHDRAAKLHGQNWRRHDRAKTRLEVVENKDKFFAK